MEKTYYIACGANQRDIAEFLHGCLENCISFSYEDEAGTLTITGSAKDLRTADYIRMEMELHDTLLVEPLD